MKRRLQRFYWISVLLTLLMMLIAVFMMIFLRVQDMRGHLKSILHASSAWTMESKTDLQSMAEDIATVAAPMRVTFIMGNGLVLADSHEDPLTMDNHVGRNELIEALRGETGEHLRISQTEGVLMLYAAERITPDLILRLAYPIEELTRMVIIYAAGAALLFLLLYLFQRSVLAGLADDMMRQMDGIRVCLEQEEERVEAVFPEFKPALDNIGYLVSRLRGNLREVERTLRLRSDFVANASHELRSPLTSVMGYAEMIEEGMADTPEERALCVGTIRSECERMLQVIEDILQLSRAERRQAENRQPVCVRAVAREIFQALAPRAGKKGVRLMLEGEATVFAAEKDIWEILYNLIENAIRYGRENGHVCVRLAEDTIAVQDDGAGIAPEHLPRIFEQFYRVDETREAGAGGTGLGLSIVRALAARNGAAVSVESEEGRGSCFTVRFGADAAQQDIS